MVDTRTETYNVGGVSLERPFKVRRLGHIGFNVPNLPECMDLYRRLLGFRISDVIDRSTRVAPGALDGLGDPKTYFTRYAGDHHSFVIGSTAIAEAIRPGSTTKNPMRDIGQLSWQVDTLAETVEGNAWLEARGVTINRTGRDMPGSNWHTYFDDPDGHNNELFYGMEQIGWDGITKPKEMYRDRFGNTPPLPQRSESQEIEDTLRDGVGIAEGNRDPEEGPFDYNVDGVMLARPFRVVKIGPVGLFVNDLDASSSFYERVMGFKRTEEVSCLGDPIRFYRASSEHHSLSLLPWSLKEKLGIPAQSTCAVLGLQVASYKQLRAAVDFLGANGFPVFEVPLEFHTGIDYAACFLDPAGHCVMLYHAMEYVNWDGQPRPANRRNATPVGKWPETLSDEELAFSVDVFQGPLG